MRPCTLLLRLLLLLAVAVLVLLLVPVLVPVPVLMLLLRFPFLLLFMPLPLQLLLVPRSDTPPSLRLEIEAGSAATTDNAYQELQDASAFPASGPPPPRLQRTEIVTITSTSCLNRPTFGRTKYM